MDTRVDRMAEVLVGYSTRIEPGDRVLLEGTYLAEPLMRALFKHILLAGGHPHLLVSLEGMTTYSGIDDVFLQYAGEHQLDYGSPFFNLAYENFESRIRIHSVENTKSLMNADRVRMARRAKGVASILKNQLARGDAGEFKWVTTLFPSNAYAQDAEMSLSEFEDFVFSACHVHDPSQDAVPYWEGVSAMQEKIVDAFKGHDEIKVVGPNCDLALSIKGRRFINACGINNMPDGEVFTGPVEDSVSGWVKFSYPCVDSGNEVDGVKLVFSEGKVVEATAEKNQAYLDHMLATDTGSRFVGEFAIGLNYGIQQHTKNILFDEKIGGSFHMALGAGYPETGSRNKSAIHWDLITDMHGDAEIILDGDVVYRDGKFVV